MNFIKLKLIFFKDKVKQVDCMKKLLYLCILLSSFNCIYTMEGPSEQNVLSEEALVQLEQEMHKIRMNIKPVRFKAPSRRYIEKEAYQELGKGLMISDPAIKKYKVNLELVQNALGSAAHLIYYQAELIRELQRFIEPLWALRELFKDDLETVTPTYKIQIPKNEEEVSFGPIMSFIQAYQETLCGQSSRGYKLLRLSILMIVNSANEKEVHLGKSLAHGYFLTQIGHISGDLLVKQF